VAYAVVRDVAASWEDYDQVTAPSFRPWPTGLLFHVAGPTDEGYRMIDIWASETARDAFETMLDPEGDAPSAQHRPPPTQRTLQAEVVLTSWRELACSFGPEASPTTSTRS
jgi:hypothetical protein